MLSARDECSQEAVPSYFGADELIYREFQSEPVSKIYNKIWSHLTLVKKNQRRQIIF